MLGDVEIIKVTEATQYILENFFTPYFFELSRFDESLPMNAHGLPAWEDFGGVGELGPTTHAECVRYNWWIRDEMEAYLIYVGDLPAGFALVLRENDHLPPGVKMELVDFYIAPRYRGKQIGNAAAKQMLGLYRGTWVLFTLAENKAARQFWRRVLTELSNTKNLTNLEVNHNETEWYFTMAGPR